MCENSRLEDVDEYVYLGVFVSPLNDLKPELARRKRVGWVALGSIKAVIDATKDVNLKVHLFNTTVLPALCYASETWSLNKGLENSLRVAHASLERRLVGLTIGQQRDRQLHNTDIRNMRKVADPLSHVERAKHR